MKNLFLIILFFLTALTEISFGAVFNVTDPASFQKALETAETNNEDNVINVAQGTYSLSKTLEYNSSSKHSLTINGAGADKTILDGGGNIQVMNIRTSGNLEINDLTIRNGNSSSYGGGLYAETRSSSMLIKNCFFTSNFSSQNGGGAELKTNNGEISMTRCLFYDNVSNYHGGGAFLFAYPEGEVHITSTIFRNNKATKWGGGAFTEGNLNFINNTLFKNTSGWEGGGLFTYFLYDNWTGNIYNNIFLDNNCTCISGKDLDIDRINHTHAQINLFNNNFSGNANFESGNSENFYINDPSLNYKHDNNLLVDPLFVNTSANDFHLDSSSPLINTGLNSAPSLPATDFQGNNRIIGGIVDMGAYENNDKGIMIGDVNGDSSINIIDALLIARYSVSLPLRIFHPSAANVDCSDSINIVDALLVARKAVKLPVQSWCGK